MTEEDAPIGPGERAKAMASLEILLRTWRKAVDCFPGDDLETILVYMTVGAASASRHLRDPDKVQLLNAKPLPDHLHQPVSGRAVAEATGLARETVRRRIDALVTSGRLVREAKGVRTITNTLSHNRNMEFLRFLIREMDGASARVRRFDPV